MSGTEDINANKWRLERWLHRKKVLDAVVEDLDLVLRTCVGTHNHL